MAQTSLTVLLRLRRQALDCARAEFAARQDEAGKAADAVRDAAGAIATEMAAASSIDSDDGLVETFIRWLPHGQLALARARTRLDHAEASAAQARAMLDSARAAVEAVEKVMELKADEIRAEQQKRYQAILDEAGSRRGSRLEP